MEENLITETIHVIQVTEHQTAFTINNLYFVELPTQLLTEEIQYDQGSRILIEVWRDNKKIDDGFFDCHTTSFYLPICISEYLIKKDAEPLTELQFLICYMFQPGDIIKLNNLEREIGDKILHFHRDAAIMDSNGYFEDLFDQMEDTE